MSEDLWEANQYLQQERQKKKQLSQDLEQSNQKIEELSQSNDELIKRNKMLEAALANILFEAKRQWENWSIAGKAYHFANQTEAVSELDGPGTTTIKRIILMNN